MENTNVKCKQCGKNIGKLNTDERPIFKTLSEGVVEYNGLFCSEKCFQNYAELNKQIVSDDFYKWMNGWADFDKHKESLDSKSTIGNDKKPNHITEFGRGYHQAVRDIFDRIRLNNPSPPVRTSDKSDSANAEELNIGKSETLSEFPEFDKSNSPLPVIKLNSKGGSK